MSIDEKVANWLKENDNLEVEEALEAYNNAWFGFFQAEPQTHTVKQKLAAYAKLKRLFHKASDTPYF